MSVPANQVFPTATSTPGMKSILNSNPLDPLSNPTTDTTGNVPTPPATGTSDAGSPPGVAAPSGGGLDLSTIIGDLFNAGSGQWYSGLGTYGGLAALGGYTASQAQKSNASTIAPINAIGQPLVNAGNQLLTQAQTGTLTPAQQSVVSTSQTQGQNLITAATPVGQIAQGLFSQYSSGKLNAGDQAQLDAQVAAAKQQLRQSLGPNVDSSMLATYDAQIDNQALITKQQMLNSYLATGNTEFDQWASTTQAGQATILEGQKYAVQQIDQTFQKALEASSLGGNDILAGIQLAVQSNTEIANALQSYYGNISKAYAMEKAGGAAGRGGASSAGGAAASAIGKAAGGALKDAVTGSPSGVSGTDWTSALGDVGTTTDQQLAMDQLGISTDTQLATDFSSQIAPDIASTTGVPLTDVLGTSATTTAAAPTAAGELAGLGTAADTTGMADIGALGYGGADAAGASGSALATIAPEAAAALAIAAPIYGAFSSPFSANSDYYSRMKDALAAGPGPYASTGGFNGIDWDPQYTEYMAALQSIGQAPSAPQAGGGSGGSHLSGRA